MICLARVAEKKRKEEQIVELSLPQEEEERESVRKEKRKGD